MERLYLGDPKDAEVDALLAQLNDENLLKLKVNNATRSSASGFQYPTFTDRWSTTEDNSRCVLDSKLTDRLSTLKLPITSSQKGKSFEVAKKKGKQFKATTKGNDSAVTKKENEPEVSMEEDAGAMLDSHLADRLSTLKLPRTSSKKEKGSEVSKKGKELQAPKTGIASAVTKKEDGSEAEKAVVESETVRNLEAETLKKSTSRRGDSSRISREMSSSEFLAFRSDNMDDLDSMDAILNERFRALKGLPSLSTNMDQNLVQFSGLSAKDYENYGASMSTPVSPSANLLGRSKSRSAPRVASTSCNCSTPSPLKLLKQVSSKSFPSAKAAALPPTSPSPRSSSSERTPTKTSGKTSSYKVEGFGNAKPIGTRANAKKAKSLENVSTVGDVRRLLSSVADRVSLERSRVSSADVDDILGDDLHAWSVLDSEQEFAKATIEEQKVSREAERVVEWAKDAARLGIEVSDSEAEDLEPCEDEDSDGSSAKAHKIVKAKKWGLF